MLLNVKTEYNYLQSLCKIDELIDFAVKKNCHQLGMVDDNSLTGVLKFINKCKEKNIKPIIGTKLTIENFYGLTSIIVYALNEEGLERINYLISIASINSPIKLADLLKENLLIVFDELKYFKNEDFINTIIEFLQKYKFDNYYIVYNEEYREINEQFKNEMSEKTIFLPEVRYMNDNDIDYFLVLNSLYNKTKYLDEKITKLNKKKYSGELVLKSYEQLPSFVAENMSNFIRNFSEYSLTTNYEKTLDFTVFNNIDFNKKLTLKLEKLLIENNNLDKEQYIKRLRKELKIIEKLKFQNYFLIMEDIVNFCQKENIIYGDGRGSAPGSLVAYLLKITKIDPIEYNLYFERFLNEQRSSLPDIDLDVSDIRRNEIITYLIEKYGDNHVAKIVTINKYLAKSALNDIGKSLDIDSNTLKKINSKIDSKLSFEENIKNNYAFFSPYLKDSKFDFLRQTLEKLENLPRNPSIHAAGVIISSTSIYKSSPIINNVVYNEAFYLEKYGYVKFDLLALSTLTFLDEMEKDIQLQDKSFKIENISLNNKTVFNSFANAQTFGIFQLESEGIKSLLTKYKPQNILDISIIISLYRPGPMKNIDLYLSNKNSPNRIKYLHPKLEPILKSTNGIIIFQEQIMEIVKELANFTNIEADIFRVAVSKKKLADLLTQKEKFIKQGIENGIDEKILERIYDNILEFANYGFNKAHALSYATLIYKLMYIKAIYPEIFYAKIFSKNVEGSHKNTLLKEIYSINLQILAPNILYSTYKHKTKNKTINLGLQQIKNISSQKLLNFIDRRNAYLKINNKINFTDFIINVFIPSGFMNNEIENFINSGAFDIFYTNHKSLIQTIEKYNENMEVFLVLEEDLTFVEIEDYTYNEKIILEKKALGFNLNYDEDLLLLQRFKKLYPKLNTIQNIELANNYTSSFIIAKMKKKKEIITKNNQLMAFFTFEINHFDYEFICFPEEYKNYKTFQTKDKVILEFAKNNQKAFILKNILDLGEK